MSIEKPQPLYGSGGQVNDPEIAREMAKEEELLRKHPEKILSKHKKKGLPESIDSQVSDVGRMAQMRKEDHYKTKIEKLSGDENSAEIFDCIAKKINKALSPEELDIFRKHHTDIANRLETEE